jgi:threonine/homoserine/homoserine lactone efflux protein
MVNLFNAITEGILLGFTLAILVGPAFFALLQTSIQNGYQSGIAFAIGVFFGDLTIILLSYLGVLQFFSDPSNNFIVGIIGGTILIIFGILNIFQKHPLEMGNSKTKPEKYLPVKAPLPIVAIKGFVINLFNPFVIIFWIGVVSVESTRYEMLPLEIISLFSATLLTTLITDIFKVFAAQKIITLLSPNVLHWINRIAGSILIFCGITLIWKVAKTFL